MDGAGAEGVEWPGGGTWEAFWQQKTTADELCEGEAGTMPGRVLLCCGQQLHDAANNVVPEVLEGGTADSPGSTRGCEGGGREGVQVTGQKGGEDRAYGDGSKGRRRVKRGGTEEGREW